MFRETHPIVGARDLARSIDFYTNRLGFTLEFIDNPDSPNYVGFRRDSVRIHMQFQYEYEMSEIRLRFLVDDPDAIYAEYQQRGTVCNPKGVHNTPWGTREFDLYDPDRNQLAFYRPL